MWRATWETKEKTPSPVFRRLGSHFQEAPTRGLNAASSRQGQPPGPGAQKCAVDSPYMEVTRRAGASPWAHEHVNTSPWRMAQPEQ